MFRDSIKLYVENLLNVLEKFEIQKENIVDQNLKNSIEEIEQDIRKGIEKISKNLEFLSKDIEWDKLNIAFFGETNAGKSTLIEALIKGNGKSIGDGRKDFTKTVSKKIYENLNFIDMPGLEGCEKKVIKEIIKATRKSHIVFYVIGTNKEPEEGTLQKVKGYLQNNAKVYSILNVRGKASVYKHKPQLIDENIKKVENRIKEKLKKILGTHYKGNLILNALLGFLSVGNPCRESLQKEQKKVEVVFGNLEKAYLFSGIKNLEDLIKKEKTNALSEIKIVNSYKLLNILEKMVTRILKNKKEFDKGIKNFSKIIESFQLDIENTFNTYKNLITNTVDRLINKMENEIIAIIYTGIENKWTEEHIKSEIDDIEKKYKELINKELTDILTQMKDEIGKRIEEIENRLELYIKLKTSKIEINIKEIINKIKATVNYKLKQLIDIIQFIGILIISLLSEALGPIGAIIAAVIYFIKKLWDWFFGHSKKREREAKQKAYNEVKNAVEKARLKTQKQLQHEFKKLERDFNKTINFLNKKCKILLNASFEINKIIHEIKKTQKEISTLLAREVIHSDAKFAYIDLSLSSGLFLLSNNNFSFQTENELYEKAKILNLKKIIIVPFAEVLLAINNCKIHNDTLYVNDEFTYRALSALKTDESFFSFLGVKKIEKIKTTEETT